MSLELLSQTLSADELDDATLAATLHQSHDWRLADMAEAARLVELLRQRLLPATEPNARQSALLEALLMRLWLRNAANEPLAWDEATLAQLAQLYRELGPENRLRHHLLRALASANTAESLRLFTSLICSDPLPDAQQSALAFVPLFQHPPAAPQALFPQLLDALQYPAQAPLVLDLANFLIRSGRVSNHPATSRADQLTALLGALVERLGQLETPPPAGEHDPRSLAKLIGESVSILVGLCDALSQIGHEAAEGKLRQALALGHRRVRTEAAAALARLGKDEGFDALVSLAAEPVVRLRALHYLDELGQLERADASHRSDEARAAGALAAWLAESVQFGAPPAALELVDTCQLRWPGFEAPVDCYLWRYRYTIGTRSLVGLGLTGPTTHAFRCDLSDLPPADIYAAFAGWHAQHPEIQETLAVDLGPKQQEHWNQVTEALAAHGYTDLSLEKLGSFFGQTHWVAKAKIDGRPGVVVVAEDEPHWYPLPPGSRGPGADEIYYIHKGRELLRLFND